MAGIEKIDDFSRINLNNQSKDFVYFKMLDFFNEKYFCDKIGGPLFNGFSIL
jgi:hypothetical protein